MFERFVDHFIDDNKYLLMVNLPLWGWIRSSQQFKKLVTEQISEPNSWLGLRSWLREDKQEEDWILLMLDQQMT